MKKLLVIFIIFLFAVNLQAEEPLEKKPFRMRDRSFEMGFANVDAGFANNLLTVSEIFRTKAIIDLTKMDKSFNLGFDLNVRPFYFNVSVKNQWGFGLDIGNVLVYGNVDLAANMLKLKHSANNGDSFGVGASAFVDIGIPAYFKIPNVWDKDLRINIRPAGFMTAVYTEPKMKYTFKEITDGMLVQLDYDVRAYAPISLNFEEGGFDGFNVGPALGFDFSVGADYPLLPMLDVGIKFINIPLKSSLLQNYLEMKGKVSVDSSKLVIEDLISGNDLPEDFLYLPDEYELNPVYGSNANKKTFRPFKMLLTADYRPFETPILTISPVLGFSVNQIFVQNGAIEIGVKASCELANLFTTTIGICYEDQLWKNSLDFLLNLYVFELGFGVAMQSQSFGSSWQGAGLRANLSLKFGF